MMNGTSFSASVGSLIAYESVGAIVLAEVYKLAPIKTFKI